MYNDEIDINYRYICFFTFAFVLLFSDNIITYVILLFTVFVRNINKQTKMVDMAFILTFIVLILSILFQSYIFLKLMIIIDYFLYFMNIDDKKSIENKDDKVFNLIYEKNKERITNLLGKGEIIDKKIMDEVYEKSLLETRKKEEIDLLRFKNNNIKQYGLTDNISGIFYVTFHLIILFISILIGSCVI